MGNAQIDLMEKYYHYGSYLIHEFFKVCFLFLAVSTQKPRSSAVSTETTATVKSAGFGTKAAAVSRSTRVISDLQMSLVLNEE